MAGRPSRWQQVVARAEQFTDYRLRWTAIRGGVVGLLFSLGAGVVEVVFVDRHAPPAITKPTVPTTGVLPPPPPPPPPPRSDLDFLRAEVAVLEQRIAAIEKTIVSDPGKALEMSLLNEQSESLSGDIDRLWTVMLGALGALAIGVLANGLRGRRGAGSDST